MHPVSKRFLIELRQTANVKGRAGTAKVFHFISLLR